MRELAGCGFGSRLRHRIHRLRRADHDASVALFRGTDPVDEPALRLHRHRRPLLHRLFHHAAEEKSRCAGTGARQDRARERPSGRAAHADEGPAAGLQQGQPGRQGAAVRHGGNADRDPAHLRRHDRRHHGQAGGHAQRALQGYATATDLADYLVKKGVPFRDAHEAVALAVRFAAEKGEDLTQLSIEQLRQFSKLIDTEAIGKLSLEGSVASRDHVGGTAPTQVRAAIASARAWLAAR